MNRIADGGKYTANLGVEVVEEQFADLIPDPAEELPEIFECRKAVFEKLEEVFSQLADVLEELDDRIPCKIRVGEGLADDPSELLEESDEPGECWADDVPNSSGNLY